MRLAAALAALGVVALPAGARAAEDDLPPPLQGVEIEEKLGDRVPAEAVFLDQDGKSVRVGDLLGKGKPVVMALVYYECPCCAGSCSAAWPAA